MSELVAILLITDPDRRPSSREILESLTVQEKQVSVTPTSVKRNATLLITSTGPWSTERHAMLGIYKEAGTKNNCPYYIQMDTERKDGTKCVIYRSKRDGWFMGPGLDEPPFLSNASKAESVPLTAGWVQQAWNARIQETYCVNVPAHIIITASVDEEIKWPECVVDYNPTKMFSLGRRVFKHQTYKRYLFVRPLAFNCTAWKVKVLVGDEEARLVGGINAIEMNPEDPRAWEWSRVTKVKNNVIKFTCDLDRDIDIDLDLFNLDFYDRTDLSEFLRHLDQKVRVGEKEKNVHLYKFNP